MKVLAIETATEIGQVAFVDDNNLLEEITFSQITVHAKEIIPSIKTIFEKQSTSIQDIDLIVVDKGPGSYTGLRIGVIVAKTLAYLLKKPVVGVYSLDAMVYNFTCKDFRHICPMIDAKWKQIYTAIYRNDGSKIGDCLAIEPERFLQMIPPDAVIFGSGAVRYRSLFEQANVKIEDIQEWHPKARHVAAVGIELYKRGVCDNPIELVPQYLRATEAELKFKG